jgi:hypothetical protein
MFRASAFAIELTTKRGGVKIHGAMSNSHQEVAASLGEMSMSFQELENSMLELFASLINGKDPTSGYIIGTQLSFRKLCQVVGALVANKTEDTDLRECFAGILKLCQKHEEERNTYIHSFYPAWYFEDGLEVFGRFKHKINKRGYAPQADDPDPEKMRTLSFELNSCTRQVNEFLKELRDLGIVPPEPQ